MDKRCVVCELVGGPLDGTKLELPGIPPASQLDIPPGGIPENAHALYEWLMTHEDEELLLYRLETFDGLRSAIYRHARRGE